MNTLNQYINENLPSSSTIWLLSVSLTSSRWCIDTFFSFSIISYSSLDKPTKILYTLFRSSVIKSLSRLDKNLFMKTSSPFSLSDRQKIAERCWIVRTCCNSRIGTEENKKQINSSETSNQQVIKNHSYHLSQLGWALQVMVHSKIWGIKIKKDSSITDRNALFNVEGSIEKIGVKAWFLHRC